jgi:outer membrane protein OmpA-like peptidoglycan-associated protein
VTQTGHTLGAALALCVLAHAGPAMPTSLDLPAEAVASADRSETLGSYALPVGPYADGAVPTRLVEGPIRQMVWRIEAPGASTLELLAPLRDQLAQAGFRPLFECETVACGGFDFRYGTTVLREPEMHVDLGDFRFFAAERGTDIVSLMVSRTATTGFVQMIEVGGAAGVAPSLAAPPVLTASTMAAPPGQPVTPPVAAVPRPLADALLSGGAVALEDLVFASGASALTEGSYPSLAELGQWLKQNPTLKVALVGHTDASGGLEGNIALSRRRAESVRQHLIRVKGVPASQIEAQGVGYLSPRDSNLTDAGREKNRRVEVMLTSTQVAP